MATRPTQPAPIKDSSIGIHCFGVEVGFRVAGLGKLWKGAKSVVHAGSKAVADRTK